jgi:hypothetical protein
MVGLARAFAFLFPAGWQNEKKAVRIKKRNAGATKYSIM